MRGRSSAARQMACGVESPKTQARWDKARIKRLRIKSPDTTKMHSVRYGKTTYFFRNKRKMDTFIRNEKHKELRGLKVREEDEDSPITSLRDRMNRRFEDINNC